MLILFIDYGFMISFSGIVTFKKCQRFTRCSKSNTFRSYSCGGRIVPYLSPHPFRGKRNEPARVSLVLAVLSEVKRYSCRRFDRECGSEIHIVFFDLKKEDN